MRLISIFRSFFAGNSRLARDKLLLNKQKINYRYNTRTICHWRKMRVLHEVDEECEFREIQYSAFDVDGVIVLLL